MLLLFMSEMRELVGKRDAISIENEEQVTNYYRIRQQLNRLEREMQASPAPAPVCVHHIVLYRETFMHNIIPSNLVTCLCAL